MTTCDADIPIGLLAILHPGAVRVLQGLGVDLALEHDRPLEEACSMRDLRVEVVLSHIARAERRSSAVGGDDWDALRAVAPRLPGLPHLADQPQLPPVQG